MNTLKRFLIKTPVIETEQDLSEFKAIVKQHMYAALLQIVFLGTPLLLFSYGIQNEILGFSDILFIIIPNSIVIFVSLAFRKLEKRGQSISTSNPNLESELQQVIHYWKKRPLPSWK